MKKYYLGIFIILGFLFFGTSYVWASVTSDCTTSAPSIKVLAPNGGENYNIGQQFTVTWASCNISDSTLLEINISKNNSNFFQFLAPSGSINDGTETFTVSSDWLPDSGYKITVGVPSSGFKLSAMSVSDSSDSTFTISTPGTAGNNACTLDAKQCPDGSFVGRTGSNCEFICPPSLVGTTTCGPASADNCGGTSIPVVACSAGVSPLSVISPNGGETLSAGQQVTTTWRSCGLSTGTNTDVYVKNLNTQKITYLNKNNTYLKNDGSETFTIPDDLVSGDYLLYVGVIGKDYMPLVSDQSNSKITISNPKLIGTTASNTAGTAITNSGTGVSSTSILEQRKFTCDFGTTLNACAALYPETNFVGYNDSVYKTQKTILKKGMKNTKVGTIQSALTKKGYNLISDGVFGSRTENAVKLFQKANGLNSDGIVGPLTEALLIE